MTFDIIDQLHSHYRRSLFEDVVPFWLNHFVDTEQGGFYCSLDRSGAVYGTDKGLWMQARAVWMLSTLCCEETPNDTWLGLARHGMDFIEKHGYDSDGRMFFTVTRDGQPLRKRRYVFSESFAAIATARLYQATGEERYLDLARKTFNTMVHYHRTPDLLEPKVNPNTRRLKSLAMPMILISTAQQMRFADDDPSYTAIIDESIDEIRRDFLKDDIKALLEQVGPNGERYDLPACRTVNPGHSIEAAWFILDEGRHRLDSSMIDLGLKILDYTTELGWDEKFGGLYAFIDIEGKPSERLEWDMKFWWPHTEALIAFLMAYEETRDPKYWQWFEKMHQYSFTHFSDPAHGEWFGYLHRDGSVANELKGSLWKGMFHVPRGLFYCVKLLRKLLDESLPPSSHGA